MQSVTQGEELSNRFVKRSKPVILCVDDQKTVLETLEEQIKSHLGKTYKVYIAESGEEALELLEELHEEQAEVAVIVSDQVMPGGMPGDEFLIKAHEMLPATRKIMLTGQANMENVGNAINKARLYRYIQKPWEADDMKMTVEEAANSYMQQIRLDEQNRALRLLHDTAQLISSKVEHDSLIRELMNALLRFSFAERAVLLLNKNDQLVVSATAHQDQDSVSQGLNQPLGDGADLPAELIRKAADDQEKIVFKNAQTESEDAYLKNSGVKSALIVPVVNSGKLKGVFYLEHKEHTGVFFPENVEIIDILTSDAGVAIENIQLYDHMEEIVNERTKELSEMYQQKLATESHKDKMIHIVSHDIRSPLSGISQLSDLLQDNGVNSNTEQVARYGALIKDAVNRVLKFVSDILDLAKLESGTIVVRKDLTSLQDYLKGIVQTFEPLAITKKVDLKMEFNGPEKVAIDANRLAQAVNNVLSNSLKFTKKGGSVTLRGLEADDKDGKPHFKIEIEDTGVGIPEEAIPTLFEKFNKFQRSGTKGEKGTGLGMSIAKEICELHGGAISVSSQVNVGTKFTLLIPVGLDELPQE